MAVAGGHAGHATTAAPEWWEVLQRRFAGWAGRHPAAVRRLSLSRAVVLWACVLVVFVAVLLVPVLRPAVAVYLRNVVLLVVLFALARTKTVGWALVAGSFAVSVPWAMAIAALSRHASSAWVALSPGTAGTSAGIASTFEEVLKLAPLLVLVVAAPGRARRFAAVDWAVLGFAAGLGFNAAEDGAREVYAEVRGPSLADLLRAISGAPEGLPYSLNPWMSARFETGDGVAVSAGHHLWTMLAAAMLGLAIALWRATASTRRRAASRALTLAVGGSGLLVAITDHAAYNAWNYTPGFPSISDSGFPAAIEALWWLTGRGHRTAALSFVVFVLCLMVDVQRRSAAAGLRAVDDRGEYRLPGVADPAWWVPDRTAQRWTAWLRSRLPSPGPSTPHRWAVLLGRGGWFVVEVAVRAALQWWHDIALILAAHVPAPGERRIAALVRGRAMISATRALREEAMTVTTPGSEPAARRSFRLVWASAAVLVGLAVVTTGLLVAARIGTSLAVQGDEGTLFGAAGDFGGLLDRLGDWWGGLSWWQQIAVGFGVAAVVALSGGSVGLAFGISGVVTYGLGHARGLSDLYRDPQAATREYLRHATPQGVLVDLAEFGLTFAPGNFAGAVAGRTARTALDDALALQRRRLTTDVGTSLLDAAARIELHLSRLDHSPANDAMLQRIRSAHAEGRALSEADDAFIRHELKEAELMDGGMTWDDAHEIALTLHPTYGNYDPEVVALYPKLFNQGWRDYWRLP